MKFAVSKLAAMKIRCGLSLIKPAHMLKLHIGVHHVAGSFPCTFIPFGVIVHARPAQTNTVYIRNLIGTGSRVISRQPLPRSGASINFCISRIAYTHSQQRSLNQLAQVVVANNAALFQDKLVVCTSGKSTGNCRCKE